MIEGIRIVALACQWHQWAVRQLIKELKAGETAFEHSGRVTKGHRPNPKKRRR